jgi:hypothetical protein
MESTHDEFGDLDDLTEAIEAVLPWREASQAQSHPFEKEFAIVKVTGRDASGYLCGETLDASQSDAGYFEVHFRWKVPGGGVFGLVWARENGLWRVVSFEAFEQ